MSEKELIYNISTLWEWNEEDNKKIKNSCREIGNKFNTEIEYLTEEQSFEMIGTSYEQLDKARDVLLKLLRSKATTAKQSLIIPHRPQKSERKPEKVELGLPPPLPDEEEKIPPMIEKEDKDLKSIFKFSVRDVCGVLGWKLRESFLPCDYWRDISIECKVTGDVVEDDKPRIEFTGGKQVDIEEAKKRLKQLELNFCRRPLNRKRIPLVHYPNQHTLFKLHFCPLQRHPYFSKTVMIDPEDVYVLVAATIDPLTRKYVLPREISDSSLQRDNYSHDNDQYSRMQENNREAERSVKGKAKAVSSTNNNYSLSSRSKPTSLEEPQYNWPSIPRPKDVLWTRDTPDSDSKSDFPDLSSRNSEIGNQNRRLNKGNHSGRISQPENPSYVSQTLDERSHPSEEQLLARKEAKEAKIQRLRKQKSDYGNADDLIDFDEEPEFSPVIKRTIVQKNPNKNNYSDTPTPGRMVRDYNFRKMKELKEGLEYARVHKGEIRLYGSLGKALFTGVDKRARNQFWEFTDLKDVLVSGGVKPGFNEIATYDDNLIEGFTEILGSKPLNKSAYFEIIADARNAPHSEYSNVYMYFNMGYVSLEKVMLDWSPLVNIDWTILDRKIDFSLNLATRRAIRHDVKPFNTFKKKTSVSPTNRMITFENVRDFLNVKAINFKQVTKFKLHYPFIAELTRVEKLPLVEQTNSNKILGKTGYGKAHFTIEIYNELHRESFKQNGTLGRGEIANWTVDNIIGVEPTLNNLVEFVKAMLLLVERCHKKATESQTAEKQEQ